MGGFWVFFDFSLVLVFWNFGFQNYISSIGRRAEEFGAMLLDTPLND